MRIRIILGCVLVWLAFAQAHTQAEVNERIYQTMDGFLAAAFPEGPPEVKALWIKPALRSDLEEALGRSLGLRVRYWAAEERTAWVLDEIGRDKPITAGFVIDNGTIDHIRVLVFRESRGWEIKHDFFTRQFRSARLSNNRELSQSIDGITGATLSVRAMTRMATAALLLHEHARAADTVALAN